MRSAKMLVGRGVAVMAAGVVLVATLSLVAQPSGGPPAGGPPPQGPAGRPGGPGGGRGDGPSVEGAMKQMANGFERLHAAAGDPAKRADALRAVGDMQRACVTAKNQVPRRQVERVADEAGKQKMLEEFRRRLIATMRTLLDVETALLDGQHDEAKAMLAKLETLEHEGHEALGVGDE